MPQAPAMAAILKAEFVENEASSPQRGRGETGGHAIVPRTTPAPRMDGRPSDPVPSHLLQSTLCFLRPLPMWLALHETILDDTSI